MLWPAVCTLVVFVVLSVVAVVRDGFAGVTSLIAWSLVIVPLVVVVVCTLLGGTAVVVALVVRVLVRAFAPTVPMWTQTAMLMFSTGVCVALVVSLSVTVATGSASAVAAGWWFAVAVGAVSMVASGVYARDLYTGDR
ncbi:MAG: hypothetical protein WA931_16845 [Rhodococcus sp. (in: high G+C Gram-positive bacteria)]